MNDTELKGYKECLNDVNEKISHLTKRHGGIKSSIDAWHAWSDLLYFMHSRKLDIHVVETEKLQPVGGM